MSTSLMSNGNYPSLNATSPSTDSLFSVSTSLNSLPSECPPRRSDLDLKMETPDEMPEVYLFEGDEIDDFFDLEKHQKGRSASFGGSTAYSSQLAMARHGLFAPSLDTIGSVASGKGTAQKREWPRMPQNDKPHTRTLEAAFGFTKSAEEVRFLVHEWSKSASAPPVLLHAKTPFRSLSVRVARRRHFVRNCDFEEIFAEFVLQSELPEPFVQPLQQKQKLPH
ncbi:unnamed protein product [Heligmosomoides polygyrus]|uniref:Uncharacterized protein n=1 Tax=Heligmosomoides polygyrus TaxID=6339 RepID=A0A183FEY4_HELPZ|nr:unnamed protein product [Heligmosomoides polygyrus]